MFDLASCLFFDKARVFQTFFYILFGITFTIPLILFFVGSQNYINSIFLILFSFVFLGIALNLEYLHRINKNLIGDSRGKKRDE